MKRIPSINLVIVFAVADAMTSTSSGAAHLGRSQTEITSGATYPTHVHNAPCATTPAGGRHHQHLAGTGLDFVNDVNEIWPVVMTNRTGRGLGHATHAQRARAEAMSIVIPCPANTTRLACVDLT